MSRDSGSTGSPLSERITRIARSHNVGLCLVRRNFRSFRVEGRQEASHLGRRQRARGRGRKWEKGAGEATVWADEPSVASTADRVTW